MAVRLDIKALQGDSYRSDPIQFLRGDTPLDLTNQVGRCQIRKYVNSGLITELKVVIDEASNGRFHLEATHDIMSLFTTGNYVTNSESVPFFYDVQFTGPGDFIQTIIYGTFYIRPEVTK